MDQQLTNIREQDPCNDQDQGNGSNAFEHGQLNEDLAKGGPPVGSTNALKSGMRASFRLTLSQAPKGKLRQYRHALAFRSELMRAVEARYGEVTLSRALTIDTAVNAFLRGLLIDSYLRTNDGKLSHSDWLAFTDRVIRFRESRDRAVDRLGIDVQPEGPKSVLDLAGAV